MGGRGAGAERRGVVLGGHGRASGVRGSGLSARADATRAPEGLPNPVGNRVLANAFHLACTTVETRKAVLMGLSSGSSTPGYSRACCSSTMLKNSCAHSPCSARLGLREGLACTLSGVVVRSRGAGRPGAACTQPHLHGDGVDACQLRDRHAGERLALAACQVCGRDDVAIQRGLWTRAPAEGARFGSARPRQGYAGANDGGQRACARSHLRPLLAQLVLSDESLHERPALCPEVVGGAQLRAEVCPALGRRVLTV